MVWKDEILDTIENWKLAYHKVEIIEDNTKEIYTPMDQSFIPRKAFDPSVMTKRYQGTMKIHIEYYDENGNYSPMATDESQIHINSVWDDCPLLNVIETTGNELKTN